MRARLDEFARHARTHRLGAAELVLRVEGAMRLLHHGRLALLAGLEREAHQDGGPGRRAPAPRSHRSRTRWRYGARFRHRRCFGLGLELHQGAALEVDAEIQADRQEQDHRRRPTCKAESGKVKRRKRMKSTCDSSGQRRSRRMIGLGFSAMRSIWSSKRSRPVPPHVRHSGAPAGRARNPDTQVDH